MNWKGKKTGAPKTDSVEEVRVSEHSRDKARKSAEYHVERLEERRRTLLNRKREIESALSCFSKAAMLKKQQEVRRQARGKNSLHRWIDVKAELDDERQKLVSEKVKTEAEIAQLTPRVTKLKREAFGGREERMISELRAIRQLLEILVQQDRDGCRIAAQEALTERSHCDGQ